MSRHFINYPTLVVIISTALFIGLCYGDILTNSISYTESVTWNIDGLEQDVGGVTTREASGLLADDYMYVACSTGVIKLNKSASLTSNSSSLFVPVVPSTITNLVAPHMVNRSNRIELWVPSGGLPARFARFNESLNWLFDGLPNPVDISVIDRVFSSFSYNGYSYFIGETGLIQVFQTSVIDMVPFTPSGILPFLSASVVTADQSSLGTMVFVGSQSGAVYKIVINEASFQTSAITRFNLTSAQQITGCAVDPIRGYVYFAESGTSNTQSHVFKMTMDTFQVVSTLKLSDNDFDVISGVIDPYGVLYFGLGVFPPKVVQISLPTFSYETTLVLPATVGTVAAPLLDSETGKLFWSSYDINTFKPQLFATTPASGCPNMCSGNGDCLYRYCYCDAFVSPQNATFNYTQPDCFGKPCDYDCYGNGTCDLALGICACNANHTGSYCDIPQCTNNCTAISGQGYCVYETDGVTPLMCVCSEGWTGSDCSVSTYLPCYRYDTCDECDSKNPNCGWCSDAGTCMDGNELGPFFETGCRNWHYRECPKGLEIVNYVILIIIILLFIINMISFTLDDTAGMEIPPRLDWYRFQRSSKAWTLLFQFQFIAACGLFDINFPTIFLSFTNFWYPLAFGWGLPTDNDSLESTSRRPLNVIQYVTYIEQTENQILLGVILWSAVVLVGALILYLFSIVLGIIRGKKDLGGNIKDRIIYVALRIVESFYFGLVVFSTTQLSQYKYVDNGMLGLAVVIFVLIGVGWPIAHLALVAKFQKNLFKKAQRVRYFPMYGTFQVLKLKFVVIPILKKFLLAVFIGFLSENRVPQLLFVWLVHILYFVFVLVADPFIDILQKYLELFIGILNILSMPVLMGFLKDDISFDAQVGVTVLFTVLQILCVVGSMAFYFISWSQMYEIFTFNQLKSLLCCQRVDPAVTELQRLR